MTDIEALQIDNEFLLKQLKGIRTEYKALRLERDQFAARVAELEEGIRVNGVCEHADGFKHPKLWAEDILNRSLPASLLIRDDDLLESAADSMHQDYNEGPGFQDGVNHAKDILLSRLLLLAARYWDDRH